MEAVAFSAGAATVLAAWQLVPQVVKLRRVSLPAGLSPTWALLGISTNVAWVAYRWSQGLWLGLPSPVIAALLYGATLWLIIHSAPSLRWAGLAGAIWFGFVGGAAVLGGWLLVGTVLGLSSGLQAAPSIWAAYRSRRPVGIAPSLWVIGLAQAVLWGYYGWARADVALVVYGASLSLAALMILGRYGYTHRLAGAHGPHLPSVSQPATPRTSPRS
jgi:hypothetical protein